MAEPLYGKEAPHDRSFGDLLKELSEELSHLIRKEIELAKVELTEKGKVLGRAAGYFGGAAIAGLMALGALTAAAILILALIMPAWIAAVIVMIIWGVVAAILAYSGKKAYEKAAPPVPEQTIQSVRDDIEWAKRQRTSSGT